jgi:hypothetical protein
MLLTFPVLSLPRLRWRDAPVLTARPQVTRWQAFGVKAGRLRELPKAKGTFVIHCRTGWVWITHDGDPRDIVLRPNESHRVDSDARMTAFAMRGDCALELQVDV